MKCHPSSNSILLSFGQVGRALQAVRRPGFDLLGFSYRAVILRNDLHRKMVKVTDLARVRVNLEHHVHFATVVRDQNLLPDEGRRVGRRSHPP